MRQAIKTKWIGPTNYHGSRIKAKCEAKTIIIQWDHAISVEDNHTAAAKELAEALKWSGFWLGGALPGSGYAFVYGGKDALYPDFRIYPDIA